MSMNTSTPDNSNGFVVFVNLAIFFLVSGLIFGPASSFFAERDSRIAGQRKVPARLTAIAAQSSNIQSIVSDTNAQMRSGEFLTGPNGNVSGPVQ